MKYPNSTMKILAILRWKFFFVNTYRSLLTIYMTFDVSLKPNFSKLCWFLGVSAVRLVSWPFISMNRVSCRILEGYVQFLNTLFKPCLERNAAGRSYVWQQMSAPCHTPTESQKLLLDNFYDITRSTV